MAGDRAVVLAACMTALLTTTVLAALVGYASSVTREGLRRTFAEATFDTAGTVATHDEALPQAADRLLHLQDGALSETQQI